jgi:hypothetical protein
MSDTKPRIERFNGSNFAIFEPRFRAHCAAKQLGDIFRPAPAAPEALALRADHDDQAKGWLVSFVENNYVDLVCNAESTVAALAALERVFVTNSTACVDMLSEKLDTLRMDEGETINDIFTRIKELGSQLASAGRAVHDGDLARKLLRALPSDYDNFREGQLYARSADNPLTLANLLPLLLTKEQSVLATKASRPKALYSGAATGRAEAAFNRGGSNGGNRNNDRRSNPAKTCNYCHNKGHLAFECRKRQQDSQAAGGFGGARSGGGAPGGSDSRGGARSSSARAPHRFALSALCAAASRPCLPSRAPAKISWIADSGASQHMTGDPTLFTSLFLKNNNYKNNNQIVLADGNRMTIEGNGDVQLGNILLRDVAYVPKLEHNLLSLSRAVEAGCTVELIDSLCTLRTGGGSVIAEASLGADGLYRFIAPPPSRALSAVTPGTLPCWKDSPADLRSYKIILDASTL